MPHPHGGDCTRGIPGGYPRAYPGDLKPVSATTWGNTRGVPQKGGIPRVLPHPPHRGIPGEYPKLSSPLRATFGGIPRVQPAPWGVGIYFDCHIKSLYMCAFTPEVGYAPIWALVLVFLNHPPGRCCGRRNTQGSCSAPCPRVGSSCTPPPSTACYACCTLCAARVRLPIAPPRRVSASTHKPCVVILGEKNINTYINKLKTRRLFVSRGAQ